MASYTFLYLAADEEHAVSVGITKDVEVQRMILWAANQPCRIVHVERFTSTIAATQRAAKLRKMTLSRRQKLIQQSNPNWLDVNEFGVPWIPALENLMSHHFSAFLRLSFGERRRPSQSIDEDPDAPEGGVPARVPVGPPWPPRHDAFRQPRPQEGNDP
ncbi:MAG: hypothetical protein WAO58_06645 [Fimbriimonadaceae bacterium]